ncbi:LamB/YcsF family protein [Arsenicicoccus sp. oral taxon 190]|uniref:LamB/YcsF family protein n=1 Tax=Arsenicicoccus sp. oral taxon 190 TaxID=1658671 RepID=UPI00067A367A|nr:5-oxoprolinase subunit PxpA [Arsenicicoccus sp. oral taxon 190]AKT50729.1 hypothetical protein ADJ73_04340 [Arsenicicoccus sp. oral taxon 190]
MRIDLNSDLGESFGSWRMGDDDAMLDVVTSANVACGFHAGDPSVMLRAVSAAAERGVVVGAHVAYRDLAGFGRRFVDVAPDELVADVVYQIAALDGMCRLAGTQVAYVKPHGALYNTIVHHDAQARAVVTALTSYDDALPLMGLPGSAVQRHAEAAGVPFVVEAFADRGYQPDGTLTPRSAPGAVLHDPEAVAQRMVRMVTDGVVEAVDGTTIPLRADSICTHGDSPGAVAMARATRAALQEAGVQVAAFLR